MGSNTVAVTRKHGILLKIKSATDALILICTSFSEKKIVKDSDRQILLLVVLMVELWLKLQIEIID